MFEPPRCPNTACPAHRNPRGRFYRRNGYYRPKCRATPVPRFVCRVCKRHFSRQTLRSDYRDHRPDLNQRVLSRICSGTGLRQTGRELELGKRNVELIAASRHHRNGRTSLRSARPEALGRSGDPSEHARTGA